MFSSGRSIPEIFNRVALQNPSKTALISRVRGELTYTSWHSFHESVCFLTLAFRELGVRPSEKVCILSENRQEWLYTDLAVLTNRAVLVPLYTNCSEYDFSYITTHSDARFLVVSSEAFLGRYRRASTLKKLPIKKVICMTDLSTPDPSVVTFSQLLARGAVLATKKPQQFEALVRAVSSTDAATIIYTSGTTGDPKGVVLSHENFIANCDGCAQSIEVSESDISLSFLPLSHVFERLAGYYFYLFSGATMAFADSLFTVLKDMREVKPTIMCAVPRFFERVYHGVLEQIEKRPRAVRMLFRWGIRVGRVYHTFIRRGRRVPFGMTFLYRVLSLVLFEKLRRHVGGNLRFFVSGGAALSRDIAYFFQIVGITILEGYGLTETSPVVAVNQLNYNRIGSVGFPLHNVAVRIADDGEILVKGPSVMQGYFKDANATRETIQDGWLYTGDVGRLDKDGYLRILDRKKDIIVLSGGKNVSPQRLEVTLVADKLFNQVVVYGDEQKHLVALIVPAKGPLEQIAQGERIHYSTFEDLVDHGKVYDIFKKRIRELLKEFAAYEKVKHFKLLTHEFTLENGELTPTFKMRRRIIYQRYKNEILALYEKGE